MPVRAAVTPPAPRRRFLLRDTDHHHAVAILPLSLAELLAGDLFLHITLHELHRRDLVANDEIVDLIDVVAGRSSPAPPATGIGNPRSSRNRITCPSVINLGTYPCKNNRSTDRTCNVT
jgi:hypothetical protein